ncbi:DEAD/DEAH box helicase [Tsukamurella sp. 8F]|uniref:DEAD/DEAH box helicase n=1 Tax=unclassified Tsukamurella TaxID=2633480 RepID=UPI0023B92164|nr:MULTISPECIES: DEAD/DEAH box helicase [unclassified Tsukamurella]MDF0530337.1 DEAD/DEAH box helicase [Tsukamurella sp. 8J]MDF0587634.1 DEAD/DEAH box helicase [Tsukamurella sp. 8F]
MTVHALWRPGAGLTLWFEGPGGDPTDDPDPAGLPAPVAELVKARRPQRPVAVVGRAGRTTVPAVTVGPARAADLLLTLAPGDGAGDLDYLRWVAASVERFVAAGSVAPALVRADDEWLLRWAPLATLAWRTWTRAAETAAPESLRRNGELAAVLDLATELTDQLCRRRLGDGPWDWIGSPALRALAGGHAVSTGDGVAAASAWAEWAGTVRTTETALVLRLVEPDAPGASRMAVLERDEQAALWRLQVCRRVDGAPPERVDVGRIAAGELDDLTGELARALAAYPPLRTAHHDEFSLDFLLTTPETEEMLVEGAQRLTDAGFEVLLPTAIAKARAALSLKGREQPGATSLTVQAGLAEIREFVWQLALGDEVLTADELAALSDASSGLVKLRGRWVRADRSTLTHAARFVAQQRAAAESGRSADLGTLLALIADPEALPAPLTSVDGLGWLDTVYRGGAITPEEVPSPRTLRADLRPYQLRGLGWLATLARNGIGAVLADDMGLGKTVQVLALMCAEREADPESAPTLLVCPMSVVGNWAAETERFAPHLRVLVHHGADRRRGAAFDAAAAASDLVVTTFALAGRDRDLLAGRTWGRVVVDEAQHLKNVNTVAARAIRAVPARHRVALTGTPVENRLEDLRAVIDLVNPGLLGGPRTFRNRYALPIERDRDPYAAQRLSTLTSPFVLRRTKTDPAIVPDLPAKDEFVVRANLTAEQAGLYQAVLDRLAEELAEADGMPRRGLVLAALTRLKQVCNHPAHYLDDGSAVLRRGSHRSGKVELLADIVETVAADGERALLFTQYAAFARMLAPWLGAVLGEEIPVLDGSVARIERDAMVARFQAGDGAPVLLATVQAGGTGLNLTGANHVVHVDRWWNPAVEDQATDRAFRIGQTKRVQVRKFVCVGTLEERIDAVISAKRELADATVRTGESWLTELGNDELYELIALRDEAVGE